MKIIALFLLFLSPQALGKLRIPTTEAANYAGKRLYISNCIGCHSSNPYIAGSTGPELWTSPNGVFQTKVRQGTYPAGYSPKRRSKTMPVFESLTTEQVDDIFFYVRSFKQ